MIHLRLSYLAICLAISSPLYAQNFSLDDTAPSWSYNPPVCPNTCDGNEPGIPDGWWQLANLRNSSAMQPFYDSTVTSTNLVGATASLNFRGIALYYYAHVHPSGGVIAMTLDENTTIVNTTVPNDSFQTLVYSQTGLNESLEHTLTVKMIGGTFVDVDRVDITPPSTTSLTSVLKFSSTLSTSTSSSTQSVIPTTGQSTGNSKPVSNGVIVGSVIAAVVVLGSCLVFGAWWICRSRRRPNNTTSIIAPFSPNMSERGTPNVEGHEHNLVEGSSYYAPWQPSDGRSAASDRENSSAQPPPYSLAGIIPKATRTTRTSGL